jgi:hypothetical protein
MFITSTMVCGVGRLMATSSIPAELSSGLELSPGTRDWLAQLYGAARNVRWSSIGLLPIWEGVPHWERPVSETESDR